MRFAAVETVFDHANLVTAIHERTFHHTGQRSGTTDDAACSE
jgi:hypothetical protein